MADFGWVCLHRKVQDSTVFQDAGLFKLWCLCLLLANYQDATVKVDGLACPVLVKRGQFLTGRFALHKAYYPRTRKSNKSAITLWRWLETLRDMGNLNIKTNSRFSLVTIVNYERYQNPVCKNEQANEQPVNSRRSAGEQPVITTNNENNGNKGVGSNRPPRPVLAKPSLEAVQAYFTQEKLVGDPAAFFNHYEANGWVQAKGKNISNWQAQAGKWSSDEPKFASRSGSNKAIPQRPGPAMPRSADEMLAERNRSK